MPILNLAYHPCQFGFRCNQILQWFMYEHVQLWKEINFCKSHREAVADAYFPSCVADIEKETQCQEKDAIVMYGMLKLTFSPSVMHLLYGVSLVVTSSGKLNYCLKQFGVAWLWEHRNRPWTSWKWYLKCTYSVLHMTLQSLPQCFCLLWPNMSSSCCHLPTSLLPLLMFPAHYDGLLNSQSCNLVYSILTWTNANSSILCAVILMMQVFNLKVATRAWYNPDSICVYKKQLFLAISKYLHQATKCFLIIVICTWLRLVQWSNVYPV